MNVDQANQISDKIKTLRESVYDNQEFKDKFKKELKSKIAAIDVEFVADPLGGWDVQVTENRAKAESKGIEQNQSEDYIKNVCTALKKSVEYIKPGSIDDQQLPNLVNVMVTGDNSLHIRI